MSDLEIVNPVAADEIRPWLATLATTFLDEPSGDMFERYVTAFEREWFADRTWGARAHRRWVATLGTEHHVLTIPGPDGGTNEIDADCLTAVTVSATHRRRGLLTQMLTASMAQAKDRGDPVTILIAAEWPIYGRFGYAPASQWAKYTLHTRGRGQPLEPASNGQLRQVDAEEIGAVAPAIFEQQRRQRAGHIDRSGEWWKRRFALDGYQRLDSGKTPTYYVHEGDDGPDGALVWAPAREFDLEGNMGAISVGDLIAANPAAYRNIWAYLSALDVVSEVRFNRRPVDEPVRWMLPNGRALHLDYAGDDLWLRILDTPAALSARSFGVDGSLVLEVTDTDVGGYAAGRFVLESDGGRSQCQPTDKPADLTLSQRALASIYLGGHSLAAIALAGLVTEHTDGALARVDAMFSTALAPWNATGF